MTDTPTDKNQRRTPPEHPEGAFRGPLRKPSKWKATKADEAWKVMCCARDAMRADALLGDLACILDTKSIGQGREGSAAVIRQFSGDQIADALLAYHQKSFDSVAMALGEKQ